MRHLDLSYNKFQIEEIMALNSVLENNNSLFGLHIRGNVPGTRINSFGFIEFLPNEKNIHNCNNVALL